VIVRAKTHERRPSSQACGCVGMCDLAEDRSLKLAAEVARRSAPLVFEIEKPQPSVFSAHAEARPAAMKSRKRFDGRR
jgi:hypothetical protein